jgi:hypothetical protein
MNDILCIPIKLNSFQLVKKYGNYNNKFIYALKYKMTLSELIFTGTHNYSTTSFTPNFTQICQETWKIRVEIHIFP